MGRHKTILISCGELSGDTMAAAVVEAARPLIPEARFWGIGGPQCARAGVELVGRIDRRSAWGLSDAIAASRDWASLWTALRGRTLRRPPAAALLVDSPAVHLPLAGALRRQGVPVVWLVGPKVWAWRPGRLRRLRARVTQVDLVFPFEPPLYAAAHVPARFVGHPVVDTPPAAPAHQVRSRLHAPSGVSLVALLPGSRPGELRRHFDLLCRVGARLVARGALPVLAPPPHLVTAAHAAAARAMGCPLWSGPLRDLLAAADAAAVASGTATLEAAWADTPMVVFYRTDPLSYRVARAVATVSHVGLPNLVAGKSIVPELVQDACTADRLYAAVTALLEPDAAAAQRAELAHVRAALGPPGVARRVAHDLAQCAAAQVTN